MNCLASREFDAVVFVGPARTGKTIGLIDGWVVYSIVCDPSDMLVVQMTEDKARNIQKSVWIARSAAAHMLRNG
jgi:phage terminase large subunit GpA-like protein